MSRPPLTPSHRFFSHDDQLLFARLSGDWNPVHVDPIEARRTPYGQIVHGVHALAWALDVYLAEGAPAPARVRASFQRPIGLNQQVTLTHTAEGSDHLLTLSGRAGVYATVRLTAGGERYADAAQSAPDDIPRHPATLSFADARGAGGTLTAWGDPALLHESFPHLVSTVGSLRTAALLGLSRLVGMVLPGLHSVFTGLDVTFAPGEACQIVYRVSRHSIPNAPVRMSVDGGGLTGTVDAFFRPAPAEQAGMAELAGLVQDREFAGQTALVIGGSRGLGESTAKLIAAGGGEVIVTYAVGAADAERVAAAIVAAGGRCRTWQLDVRSPEAALAAMLAAQVVPTHVYYFASPPIHANRGPFDSDAFQAFCEVYVASFARLCRGFGSGSAVRMFYPSTVFLEHTVAGFAEYICAKAAGEALCAELARDLPSLSFVVERLPKTHTDQTNSFLEKRALAAHDVMLPVCRVMASREHGQ